VYEGAAPDAINRPRVGSFAGATDRPGADALDNTINGVILDGAMLAFSSCRAAKREEEGG
jgi:hypothetical protein